MRLWISCMKEEKGWANECVRKKGFCQIFKWFAEKSVREECMMRERSVGWVAGKWTVAWMCRRKTMMKRHESCEEMTKKERIEQIVFDCRNCNNRVFFRSTTKVIEWSGHGQGVWKDFVYGFVLWCRTFFSWLMPSLRKNEVGNKMLIRKKKKKKKNV